MLIALAIGLAWAAYNLNVAGPFRNDEVVRNLVWAVFATPFAFFLGWIGARRHEIGVAAFCCFCLYFFSFDLAGCIGDIHCSVDQRRYAGSRASACH